MNIPVNPLVKRILVNPIIGYTLVAALIFVTFQLVNIENNLKFDQTRIQELSANQGNIDPVKLFFRDTKSDSDVTRVIDKSYSIYPDLFDSDLWSQEEKLRARLLVFIDNTDPIMFEKETGDIVKYAGTSDTSLLAINITDTSAALHLSPDANVKFTDQEAKAFIDSTVVPAIKDGKLHYAVASTIQKFNVQLSGDDFYTASQMKDFSDRTSIPGTTKDDAKRDMVLYESTVRTDQSQEEVRIVIIAILVMIGFYQIWATRQRTYGFVFGMAAGFSGYILKTELARPYDYFGYQNHMLPLIITIVLSGLAGLFIDYLVSVPSQRAAGSAVPQKTSNRK